MMSVHVRMLFIKLVSLLYHSYQVHTKFNFLMGLSQGSSCWLSACV